MSREQELLGTTRVNDGVELCDGSRPVFHNLQELRGLSDSQLMAYHEHLAAYLSGYIADMRQRFHTVRNCPEAEKFATFFDHCDEMRRRGEPAYMLMYENT